MTRSTRGEELLLLLLMLLYLLLCSDSRHAKRAENVNAIDRKSSEFVAGKLGKKDMISAFQRTTLSLRARKWTRTSSKASKRKSKRDVIVSFAKRRRSFGERNEDVNDIKEEEEEFAGERTTTTVSTLRHALMTTLAILALSDTLDANAAQVVDWLTSGAEASPARLAPGAWGGRTGAGHHAADREQQHADAAERCHLHPERAGRGGGLVTACPVDSWKREAARH